MISLPIQLESTTHKPLPCLPFTNDQTHARCSSVNPSPSPPLLGAISVIINCRFISSWFQLCVRAKSGRQVCVALVGFSPRELRRPSARRGVAVVVLVSMLAGAGRWTSLARGAGVGRGNVRVSLLCDWSCDWLCDCDCDCDWLWVSAMIDS